MPAYMIAYQKIHDPAFEDEYNAGAMALLDKHGGEVVALGVPVHLEGDEKLNDVGAIIRFPDIASARAFCNDPDYAPLIELRTPHSDTKMWALDAPLVS